MMLLLTLFMNLTHAIEAYTSIRFNDMLILIHYSVAHVMFFQRYVTYVMLMYAIAVLEEP